MRYLLFALLLLPFTVSAQYNNGMDLWKEIDCYKHVIEQITMKAGKISDTCEPVFNTESKEIYVIRRSYLSEMPDTINGYRIHYFDDGGDLKQIYNELKGKDIPVLFFAKWINHLEDYQFLVFAVKVKKKEIKYDTKTFRFHYYFHHENGKFEYKKNGCVG